MSTMSVRRGSLKWAKLHQFKWSQLCIDTKRRKTAELSSIVWAYQNAHIVYGIRLVYIVGAGPDNIETLYLLRPGPAWVCRAHSLLSYQPVLFARLRHWWAPACGGRMGRRCTECRAIRCGHQRVDGGTEQARGVAKLLCSQY